MSQIWDENKPAIITRIVDMHNIQRKIYLPLIWEVQ